MLSFTFCWSWYFWKEMDKNNSLLIWAYSIYKLINVWLSNSIAQFKQKKMDSRAVIKYIFLNMANDLERIQMEFDFIICFVQSLKKCVIFNFFVCLRLIKFQRSLAWRNAFIFILLCVVICKWTWYIFLLQYNLIVIPSKPITNDINQTFYWCIHRSCKCKKYGGSVRFMPNQILFNVTLSFSITRMFYL